MLQVSSYISDLLRSKDSLNLLTHFHTQDSNSMNIDIFTFEDISSIKDLPTEYWNDRDSLTKFRLRQNSRATSIYSFARYILDQEKPLKKPLSDSVKLTEVTNTIIILTITY